MAVIDAVITDEAIKYWPQIVGRVFIPESVTDTGASEWDIRISSFKVGEGGWIDPGTGAVPRTPDSSLVRLLIPLIQDIDAIVDPTRAFADQRYPTESQVSFTKSLGDGDFLFEAPGTIRARCFLDFADFNDDGFGNDPEIWEIGLFSDHPTESGEKLMVAYGTFQKQTKNGGTTLENFVRITFA